MVLDTSSFENDNVLVVIGSGPGIGRAATKLFALRAQNKIALISRSSSSLASEKTYVEEAALKANRSIEVRTWALDVADNTALTAALAEMDEFGVPEVVFFNAARVVPSTLLESPASEIEYDFKITNIALYTTAQWAIPRLSKLAKSNPNARPSLLVTNSLLYLDPIPEIFSLSLTKAAQRSLVLSLEKQFGKEVHIAVISVGGFVSPDAKVLNPDNIAEDIWKLYRQAPSEYTSDIVLVEES